MKNTMYNITKAVLSIIIIALIVISCEKEKPSNNKPYPYTDSGFYFVNEGNFTWGNGTLSFFSLDSLKVYNKVFSTVSGMPLGDIPIRVNEYLGRLYIIVNNSGRVEILDTNSGTYYGSIEGLVSPRDIAFLGEGKAVISSLYSDSLTLVNIIDNEILSYINIGCSSECIQTGNDYIFVSNWSDGNKIVVLDLNTLDIVKTIDVVKEPSDMLIDKDGNLRVICSGGYMNDEFPALISIDMESLEVISSLNFPDKDCSPSELVINNTLDTMYYLNGGIYRITYNATSIPEDSFIESDQRNLYRLGYNRAGDKLIVTDAVDYVQKGYIYLYSATGQEIFKAKTNIIPGKISN